MIWLERHDEILRREWTVRPAREIASIIGEGATKNSVISRANRIGLAKKRSVNEAKIQIKLVQALVPITPKPGWVTLIDLANNECHYPEGPPYVYCGQRAEIGDYCSFHHALMHRPESDSISRFKEPQTDKPIYDPVNEMETKE